MRFSTVLFDLDGTLVDSGPMILASYRHATRLVLRREVPDELLLALVGGPSLREQMGRFGQEHVDELVRVYREHNEPLHAGLAAFPGIERVLRQLRAEGRRLAVVTAKRRATVELAFAAVPIGAYFDLVVGAEDTERHKPDPAPLLRALERLGVPASEAAYVGDSPYDLAAARAAGIFSVWVEWGGIHGSDRAHEESPDAIARAPEELLAFL